MKPHFIPKELKGKAIYEYAVKNEAIIIHAKKSTVKYADSMVMPSLFVDEKGTLISKAAAPSSAVAPISADATKMNLNVVINTTNYYDSHWDVHIPGLWKKSLADNKKNGFYLLNAHQARFEQVIGEGMAGATKIMGWKDLGFDYSGVTEALIFSGPIEKIRNPFMFNQYANGYVKQHSVGMQYVKIVTCINDDDYPVQKENWDKYRPMVVNGDEVDEEGIFWAILEAKITEGSAVLFGSNDCTPTMEVEEIEDDQPGDGDEVTETKVKIQIVNDSTVKEPAPSTPQQPNEKSWQELIKQTKLITI